MEGGLLSLMCGAIISKVWAIISKVGAIISNVEGCHQYCGGLSSVISIVEGFISNVGVFTNIEGV